MAASLGPTGITGANSGTRLMKQKVEAAVGSTVMNVSSWTALVSVNITVSAGSSCLVMFNGEQNGEGGDAWQWVALFRGNTQIGTTVIEVSRQTWNSNFHNHYWDENLSAGTYTYSLKVYNGANYMRWGEHSGPRIQVVEFAK